LSKSPRLVPIPSATRLESIESSVRAESLRLDPSEVEEIEDAFRSLPD
jgi:aryl-alcohol dehydrogenase-like predicted oxidoreductase